MQLESFVFISQHGFSGFVTPSGDLISETIQSLIQILFISG